MSSYMHVMDNLVKKKHVCTNCKDANDFQLAFNDILKNISYIIQYYPQI